MTLHDDLITAGLPVLGIAVEGTTVLFTRPLTAQEDDVYEKIVNPVAWERKDFQGGIDSAIQTLTDIENAASPTNAQVIAAVRFMAKTLRLLLKLLVRQYI